MAQKALPGLVYATNLTWKHAMLPGSSRSNLVKLLAAILLAGLSPAYAQQPAVAIKTYGHHVGGNLVYHHEVTNHSSRNLVEIAIGLDTDQTSPNAPPTRESGELNFVMPLGAGVTNLAINPAAVYGPTGWRAEIVQIEDSGRYLQWRPPGYPAPGIQPGQTAHFSVTVPATAAPYLTGHFSAGYGDGKEPWHVNGAMEKLDVTPPSLSIALRLAAAAPTKDGTVSVTTSIDAHDDYDPQPEIKLESITCNGTTADCAGAQPGTDVRQFRIKAGRICTASYSATDGSGNKSINSATLAVPR